MSSVDKNRRTNLERIKDIFTFIENQIDVFPKSKFKEIGLNPRTAEMWLKMIEYIQNQPRIRLIQAEHNLLVEKVEGKYQALMRKMSVDENVPFDQRMQYLTDYLKSLYIREKVKETPKSPIQKGDKASSIVNPQEIINQILSALDTFAMLDPIFEQYTQLLRDFSINHSDEEQFIAISNWQKKVLLNKTFQMNLKRILDRDFYIPLLGEITKKIPDFVERLKMSKETIQTYYSYLHENFADWFFDENKT
jgi:hypothetical protein